FKTKTSFCHLSKPSIHPPNSPISFWFANLNPAIVTLIATCSSSTKDHQELIFEPSTTITLPSFTISSQTCKQKSTSSAETQG
ncbi:hypothetical protein VIGAN_01289700, partial [Vigna angularis var. angularis]